MAFSAALTLKKAGVKVESIVEPDDRLHTYEAVARGLGQLVGIFHCSGLHELVRFWAGAGEKASDFLSVTAALIKRCCAIHWLLPEKFRPEATILYDSGIELDPYSKGPVVDG